MTTLLDKTLKREVRIGDRAYIVAISPLALKLTPKGKRKGLELNWEALVSGDAALVSCPVNSRCKAFELFQDRVCGGGPDKG